MVEKACKKCHFIVIEGNKCPNCGAGSEDLTEKWNDYVYVFDPNNSKIAGLINAKTPGRYALKIKG